MEDDKSARQRGFTGAFDPSKAPRSSDVCQRSYNISGLHVDDVCDDGDSVTASSEPQALVAFKIGGCQMQRPVKSSIDASAGVQPSCLQATAVSLRYNRWVDRTVKIRLMQVQHRTESARLYMM